MNIRGSKNIEEKNFNPEQIGLMLWKLESIEDFYPTYKTMIKKE